MQSCIKLSSALICCSFFGHTLSSLKYAFFLQYHLFLNISRYLHEYSINQHASKDEINDKIYNFGKILPYPEVFFLGGFGTAVPFDP